MGVSWPWNLGAAALLGIAVMAAPDVLDIDGAAADLLYILGPVAVTIAVIATAEVIRAMRYLNMAVGVAIGVTGWLLSGVPALPALALTLAGLAIVALSVRRGPVRERYGSWQAATR